MFAWQSLFSAENMVPPINPRCNTQPRERRSQVSCDHVRTLLMHTLGCQWIALWGFSGRHVSGLCQLCLPPDEEAGGRVGWVRAPELGHSKRKGWHTKPSPGKGGAVAPTPAGACIGFMCCFYTLMELNKWRKPATVPLRLLRVFKFGAICMCPFAGLGCLCVHMEMRGADSFQPHVTPGWKGLGISRWGFAVGSVHMHGVKVQWGFCDYTFCKMWLVNL